MVVLDTWRFVHGVAPAHGLELGLVGHCHGTDFLVPVGLECCCVEEDSHRKTSMTTSGGLSDTVLVTKLRKMLGSRSCCGIHPFVWRAWRPNSPVVVLPIVVGRWRVARCDHPKLHSLDVELVVR